MQYSDRAKRLISPFISDQMPLYVKSAYGDSIFIKFVKAYYEWLEKSYVNTIEVYGDRSISAYSDRKLISVHDDTRPEVGNVYDRLKRLSDFNDIDNTIEPLLDFFRSEYIPDFPNDIVSDERKLIKLIKEIYTLKGTKEGFSSLFSALYGKKAYMVYPRENKLFQPSGSVHGYDSVVRVVKLSDTSTDEDFKKSIGTYLVGEESGVKISVIGVTSKSIGTVSVIELSVDRTTLVSNEFVYTFQTYPTGERVRFEDSEGYVVNNDAGIPLKASLKASITGITITEPGSGYRYDDEITAGGTSEGVVLKVKSLSRGKVDKIIVDNIGGSEYVNGTEVTALNTYFEIYGDGSYNGTIFEGFQPGDTITTSRGASTAVSTLELIDLNNILFNDKPIDNTQIPVEGVISDATTNWATTPGNYPMYMMHISASGTAPYNHYQTGAPYITGIGTIDGNRNLTGLTIDEGGTGYEIGDTFRVSHSTIAGQQIAANAIWTLTGFKTRDFEPNETIWSTYSNASAVILEKVSSLAYRIKELYGNFGNYPVSGYYSRTDAPTITSVGVEYNTVDGDPDGTITGQTSGTTATVLRKVDTDTYKITNIDGTFQYGESVTDGTSTAWVKLVEIPDVEEATADIRIREGNKLWVDNISGTFETDESVGKEYGGEIVKTNKSLYGITPTESGGTGWTFSIYYWAVPHTANGVGGTVTGGSGATIFITTNSGGQAKFEWFVTGGSGYSSQDVLVFTEPGTSDTLTLTIPSGSVLGDDARIDRIVEVGSVSATGKIRSDTGVLDFTGNPYPSDFLPNDIIKGVSSGATATIESKTNTLKYVIKTLRGSFASGENIESTKSILLTQGTILTGTLSGTLTSYTDGTASSVALSNSSATGSGTIYATAVVGQSVESGIIESVTILTGGNDYTVGDTLTVGDTAQGVLTATAAGGGALIIGTYTGITQDSISPLGGTGAEFTVVVEQQNGNIVIESCTPTRTGSGYSINDIITVNSEYWPGGGADLTITVNTITAGAAVFTVSSIGFIGKYSLFDDYTPDGKIESIDLVSRGAEFYQVPKAYAPWGSSSVVEDPAMLQAVGSHIGGIDSIDIVGKGIVDSTTTLSFRDPTFYDIRIVSGAYENGMFEVGHTLYQGTSQVDAIATGVVEFIDYERVLNETYVRITDIAGSGSWSSDADIKNDQSRFTTPPLIIANTNVSSITQLSNVNKMATAVVKSDAIVDLKPIYTSVSGHLNEEARIKDSYEYNEWSYILRTSVNPSKWIGVSKNLLHPAGMQMISDFTVDGELNTSASESTDFDFIYSLTLAATPTGTFSLYSTVYQGAVNSETSTGKVVSWDSVNRILEASLLTGTFTYSASGGNIKIDASNYGAITHINGEAQ